MPTLNSIAEMGGEMKMWRRHLHAHPDLGMDCGPTAAFVVDKLRAFGVDEVHPGIGQTGVVALIHGRAPGPTIGLRADMDALPMADTTGAPHASLTPGRAHACGHDGHTTMLLGVAKYLSETRAFAGIAALIFQPGEEIGEGGKAMLADGLMDRFAIAEVYALHTDPTTPLGHFATRPGPFMAAVTDFEIEITGKGGHGAYPQDSADPVAAALMLGQGIMTILARNTDANDQLVISLTQIHAGSAPNVIPDTARLGGTIRSYRPEVQDMALHRLSQIAQGTAAAMGVTVTLRDLGGLAPVLNDPACTAFAAETAATITGDATTVHRQLLIAEDFGAMLAARPGAMLFLGQGVGPGLHETGFDFNDAAAPIGASFFARLIERRLPLP